ncbi:putative methyltransferase-domain-containing protein [Coprinopsis sp. MPI-PUGE-AT-0042]|nr:putative methyltransferase-domain-containing protein [Coprinopsis sp. MPI-PUGE-AT-0042]
MFFYLSCLRPPLAQAPPSSPVTITPQIANDLRTEPFGSVQDLYYSWLHEVPGKPPVFTATTKLTTYRQATAYKEIPVPVPKGLKENQQWTLVLTASSRSPPECTLPLGADDIGSTPFAALSMPITFTSKAGKWGQKQEQIERIYSFSVTRTLKAQEESTESASAPQILKVSLRIREQTSFDLDKKIWDSGIGLSSWLVRIAGDRDVDFASSSVAEAGLNRLKDILSVNRAQRILELGSGIGIVSLVLAALREGKVPSGEPQDEILSTDLDTAIPLLGHNIAANKRFYLSVDLKAAVLDWEGDLSQIGNNQRFDFVVMADVTYNTSSFPVLVNTLRSIVEANPDTRPCFLLGYKQRDESERSLWDMAKAIGLHFAQVGEIPGYGGAPIEIWIA